MSLKKVVYEDGKTVIQAENLNDIQDELIEAQAEIERLKAQGASTNIVNAVVE